MNKQPQADTKQNLYLNIAFIAYCLLAVYAIFIHEQWRDEAQAWLLVRDLSLIDLLKILRTEGHPPLWYLLIMPLSKAGLAYGSQNLLTAIVMCSSVYLLLFKTKLPLLLKLLLPFSYFFLYEYLFFARSYCLIAFFTMAIMVLYPKRLEQPWLYALCIVALFNTHVLMFTFCGALVLLYLYELKEQSMLNSKKHLGASVLMSVGGLYLLPYLFFAKMSDEFAKEIDDSFGRLIGVIDGGLTISQTHILGIVLLIAALVLLYKSPKALFIAVVGLVSTLYILGFKYYTAELRHFGTVFFVLLVSVFISQTGGKPQKSFKNIPYTYLLIAAILILQLKPALMSYKEDLTRPYSGTKGAAEFIEQQGLKNNIIVGHNAWVSSAVLPYWSDRKKIFYGECNRYGTYYIYDSCFINNNWSYPVDYSIDRAYDNFKDRLDGVVFLFNNPVSEDASAYLELLYRSPEPPIRSDEEIFIYKFKEGIK